MQSDTTTLDVAVEHFDAPRFPVRWRWTIFVGLAVTAAVAVLSMIVLDMEREA